MSDAKFQKLRFAPSPNGYLHLGHAYSAILNAKICSQLGAEFLLRMEDIDQTRSRIEYAEVIYEDLRWLGLTWSEPVMHQSERFSAYEEKLNWLIAEGLVYRAFLSRKEIKAFAEAHRKTSGCDWPRDPDGAPLYPDLCKQQSSALSNQRAADGEAFTWRLDMAKAIAKANSMAQEDLTWTEYDLEFNSSVIKADPPAWGDVIIARRDVPTSYHLSVVLDDAEQDIDLIVRGVDLYHATSVHRLLQVLFELPEPRYVHHKLILDEDGRKLSKSNQDTSLRALREEQGKSFVDIEKMLGF